MWATFICHLTREPTVSPVLITWWNCELTLAINFGNPCTNGHQSWWPKFGLPTYVLYQTADYKSTPAQVTAQCYKAISHYWNQFWHRFMMPYVCHEWSDTYCQTEYSPKAPRVWMAYMHQDGLAGIPWGSALFIASAHRRLGQYVFLALSIHVLITISTPSYIFGQEGSPRTQPRRHALESNNQKFRKCGISVFNFFLRCMHKCQNVSFCGAFHIEYSTETESVLYLLMPWTLVSPCHQQSQYNFWLNIVFVVLKVNLNKQYHFSVEVQLKKSLSGVVLNNYGNDSTKQFRLQHIKHCRGYNTTHNTLFVTDSHEIQMVHIWDIYEDCVARCRYLKQG